MYLGHDEEGVLVFGPGRRMHFPRISHLNHNTHLGAFGSLVGPACLLPVLVTVVRAIGHLLSAGPSDHTPPWSQL